MSSKRNDSEDVNDSKHSEGKYDYKNGDDDIIDEEYYDDSKDMEVNDNKRVINVNVIKIDIEPSNEVELTSGFDLNIAFELDQDVVAGYWVVQFLVDTSNQRVIKVLGETDVEDYPEGDSEMSFNVKQIDFNGITPSTLSNSGLLQAIFMVDGDEIAYVNMVVNVIKKGTILMREILNPLD